MVRFVLQPVVPDRALNSVIAGPALKGASSSRAFLILGMAVFAASMLGLASRHSFSISFWPANAVLVGLILRRRHLHHPAGWLGAGLGYIVADLLFGRTLSLAAFFALANLVGSFTAVSLLCRLNPLDLALRRIHAVPRILGHLLPACFAAALCGAVLVVVEFKGSASQALLTWPASELVNYLIVLPAMLTVRLHKLRRAKERARLRANPLTLGPVVVLLASCAGAVIFDGPGSIIFPLPGLLLCALVYPIPLVALITMLLGTSWLTMLGLGIIDIGQDMAVPLMVVSIRIAVAFLVLVPLTISSAMAVHDDLLGQLRKLADQDGLTGLLNRRAFEERLFQRLQPSAPADAGLLILWLDIDHFKAINDQHGHLAGDAVLQAFATTAQTACRGEDLIGRVGGEEFAIAARVPTLEEAKRLGERVRRSFAAQTVSWEGHLISATVSIGACYMDEPDSDAINLIKRLDDALYRAKRQGRNRIEWLEHRTDNARTRPEVSTLHVRARRPEATAIFARIAL